MLKRKVILLGPTLNFCCPIIPCHNTILSFWWHLVELQRVKVLEWGLHVAFGWLAGWWWWRWKWRMSGGSISGGGDYRLGSGVVETKVVGARHGDELWREWSTPSVPQRVSTLTFFRQTI
jgi:hypothetical protein